MGNTFNNFIKGIQKYLKETDKNYSGANIKEKILARKKDIDGGAYLGAKERKNIAREDNNYIYSSFIKYNISDDGKYLILSYDMLGLSAFRNILEYTRGIVLDTTDFNVIMRPFDKFYNVGEQGIDYKNADNGLKKYGGFIVNKLDGSISSMRSIDNNIIIASKGSMSKEKTIYNGKEFIPQTVFMEKRLTENDKEFIHEFSNHTIMFEYIGKEDEKTVEYDTEGLYLIGMRDMKTNELEKQEFLDNVANKYGIKRTKSIPVKDMEEVNNFLNSKEMEGQEGFVIYINNGDIIKIKKDTYLKSTAIKTIINSFSKNKLSRTNKTKQNFKRLSKEIAELIINENYDDYIAKIKDKELFIKLIEIMEEGKAKLKNLKEKTDFNNINEIYEYKLHLDKLKDTGKLDEKYLKDIFNMKKLTKNDKMKDRLLAREIDFIINEMGEELDRLYKDITIEK